MIPVYIRIQYDGWEGLLTRKGRLSRRAARILREGHRRQALLWHSRFLKRHFSRRAISRYGYRPRSGKYRRYKAYLHRRGLRNVAEPDTPLVFSGLTRQKMLGPPQVKAFPSRATLLMPAPSYASMRPRKGNRPNIPAELTAVAGDERQTLEKTVEQALDREFQRIPARVTVTV